MARLLLQTPLIDGNLVFWSVISATAVGFFGRFFFSLFLRTTCLLPIGYHCLKREQERQIPVSVMGSVCCSAEYCHNNALFLSECLSDVNRENVAFDNGNVNEFDRRFKTCPR